MHGMNRGSLLRGRGRSIAYMLYQIYVIYILQVNLFIIFMHLVVVIDHVLF